MGMIASGKVSITWRDAQHNKIYIEKATKTLPKGISMCDFLKRPNNKLAQHFNEKYNSAKKLDFVLEKGTKTPEDLSFKKGQWTCQMA